MANFTLSEREKEVLKLIIYEHTTNEIAQRLFLSQETIRTYRKNLLCKLDARNVAGLVRRALQRDIIPINI
ncbi:MAG: helix-turn-helix transcriptional regulator [Saprospiraceae bacterium]|nr:helix-turn-helix transcriptional regulator [Saprospiraceae bacterium]